jgi:2-iminobutanoate/2-iminopropanoate deaminase
MADLPSPEPFYSLTRRAGDMLYLSGFGPVHDLQVVGADIAAQTQVTMDLMTETLTAEQIGWADVVRVNVFLLNMEDRDGFNEAYMRYFVGVPQMPTRRLVGAGDMYKGILVEIDAIAYLGEPK